MPHPPRPLIIQTTTDPDRLADRLLLRAYLLVVPFRTRSLDCRPAPSLGPPSQEQDREQAR
jgi:hypothetical protein